MRAALALCLLAFAASVHAAPDFDKDIKPILTSHCVRCHGGEKTAASLDLRAKSGLLDGGDGGPAVSPGSPEKSLLWIHVAADKMPPGKEKLTTAQKTLLREWIEQGAKGGTDAKLPPPVLVTDKDRDFWSFKSPKRPALPLVKHPQRTTTPIDAFILAALDAKSLSLAPEAPRVTLIRRVTFGLTGLPPTPEEVDAFLNDASHDAYERLVDRLLSSPAYGERWGRHWLDAAGYADSEGILDADYVRSAAWRYRDYVVRATNSDKPYDRFLQEQIAGDELTGYHEAFNKEKKLPPEVIEGLEATGFLRCASDTSRPDFVSIKNAPGYYFQTLDDTLKIVATSTMGLTLHCAKCHSHKFDPIPQRDYYHMQAVFMGAYRPSQWVPQVQRRVLEATASEQADANKHNAGIDALITAETKKRTELVAKLAKRLFDERLAILPAAIRDDVRVAIDTPAEKRTEVQKYLAMKFQGELRPTAIALEQLLSQKYPQEFIPAKSHAQTIVTLQAKKVTLPEIRALYDLPGEVPTHILRRGDYLNPGAEVKPAALTVLNTGRATFAWTPPAKEAKTSGRRLAFAKWLTQPDHPLTSRVAVNRLWLHHFGEGIVATPDNFGRSGSLPSHPELLDWLSVELVESGWSLKHIHRLIVLSSVYRQVSAIEGDRLEAAKKVDPANQLLWRQRLRRLEAEAIRDAILSVSGSLSARMYGTPVPIIRSAEGEVVTPATSEGDRRSVYVQVRRSQPVTILQVFDQPVIETNCSRRTTSTVSSQALTMLNSDFVTAKAEQLAVRALREQNSYTADRALWLALGRAMTAKECELFAEFLAKQTSRYSGADARKRAMTDLCHMLLSCNEFAYID